MIAQGLYFSSAKNFGEIPTESPPTGAPTIEMVVGLNWRFSTNISLYLRNNIRVKSKKHCLQFSPCEFNYILLQLVYLYIRWLTDRLFRKLF